MNKYERKRLIDVFSNPENDGIIKHIYNDMSDLGELFRMIFERLEPNLIYSMDMDYIYKHSGFKKISYFMECLLELFNGMTDDAYNRIIFVLSARFFTKWYKLWDTITINYDILSPYDMTISENIDDVKTITKTVNNKNNRTDSNTNIENISASTKNTDTNSRTNIINENSNTTIKDDTQDKTFGFNSENEVPETNSYNNANNNTTVKNDSITTENNERVKTDTAKTENSENKTRIEDNNETLNSNVTNPIKRNVTRKGNIGNITRQQLINEQRKLLQWQFFDVIYNDIDSILTSGMF